MIRTFQSLHAAFCALQTRRRRGMTLIELLVVIVILMMVTAIAIPVLAPNVEQRRIREAARLVSGYIDGARTRAMANGRPVGVQLERLVSNSNASMTLSYVEVPPIYAGDTINARCTIERPTTTTLVATMDANFTAALVQAGDVFKANFQGHSFTIDSIDSSGPNPKLNMTVSASAVLPWTTAPVSQIPYQIARQPIKSMGAPLQLPEGTVVDLVVSGESTASTLDTTLSGNPTILFSAAGTVSQVFYFEAPAPPLNTVYRSPTGPVHLLVGRSDGVGVDDSTFTDPKVPWNLRDLNNLWVSVSTQNGMVSTAENARVTTGVGVMSVNDPRVAEARAIANTFQSMGGR